MKIILCLCLCILIMSNGNAYCEIPLGTIEQPFGGGEYGIKDSVNVAWEYDPFGHSQYLTLLDFGNFTTSDVGKTVSLFPDTAENFDLFTSQLTDGIDRVSLAVLVEFGGSLIPDSRLLNKFVNTPYVDLYGYEITRIDLTMNSLDIVSPGQNPNDDGMWTDFNGELTFTLFGTPEPATVMLLGLGGMILRRKINVQR